MNGKTAYLDTSALAKWYLNEINSEQVADYIVNLNSAVISTLSKTELRFLLARRKRTQEISVELENQIYTTFLEDIEQGYLLVHSVENKHLESATHLISMLPEQALRTLDALHLAIAGHYQLETIATADLLLAKAAKELGFTVDFF